MHIWSVIAQDKQCNTMYIQTLFVSCINCSEYGLGQKPWPGFELKQWWCRQAMKCLLDTLHKDKHIEDKLTLVVFVLLHTSHLLMQVFYWYVNGTIKYGTVQDDWYEYPSYCVKSTLLAIYLWPSDLSYKSPSLGVSCPCAICHFSNWSPVNGLNSYKILVI